MLLLGFKQLLLESSISALRDKLLLLTWYICCKKIHQAPSQANPISSQVDLCRDKSSQPEPNQPGPKLS